MAHRWLRAPDEPGCASNVSFGKQRLERDEQVQIDGNQIHHVNSGNSINRLDEWCVIAHTRGHGNRPASSHRLTTYTPMTHLQSRHLFTMTIKLHRTEELG